MITLVLGGTRSGKSSMAEKIAAAYDRQVTYVATAAWDPTDADHRARIEAHQARRPADWTTVEFAETSDLASVLTEAQGVALVDSLGTWVSRHVDFVVDTSELLQAMTARTHPTVIVSEEVGLAVHPPTEIGRRYVDAMGLINQQVAHIADRVLFVVAGRAIEVPAP